MLGVQKHLWGDPPTVSKCEFSITEVGTTVYDHHGEWIGNFETESAAVEAIRELERNYAIGVVDDGI